MNSRVERLKKLDALVGDAAARLRALAEENKRLRAELSRAKADNAHLSAQFQKFRALSRRQEAVRKRVEKLGEKLGKALEMIS